MPQPEPDVERITSCLQFIQFATRMGVRTDWHEPDEQGLTARVEGTPFNFDNAMSPGETYGAYLTGDEPRSELHVIFTAEQEDGSVKDVAVVNLASLCSWASGGRCRDADATALENAYQRGYSEGRIAQRGDALGGW